MVTRREFDMYRQVQKEGKYNMLSKEALIESELSKDVYFDIIDNYHKYFEMYGCAWNIIKDIKEFAMYLPSLCRVAKNTDIVYFDANGLSLPIPAEVREQVYEAEEHIEGIVYAVIDSESEICGDTVEMRSFLFYSLLDEDEPIFAESYDKVSVVTYAYVMNQTWDIKEAGSITIEELPYDGRVVRIS